MVTPRSPESGADRAPGRAADNAKIGLHLAYLKRYLHQGAERVSAIWHDKVPSPFVSPALDSSAFVGTLRTQRKAKRLLRGVAAVQTGGDATFTGIWS